MDEKDHHVLDLAFDANESREYQSNFYPLQAGLVTIAWQDTGNTDIIGFRVYTGPDLGSVSQIADLRAGGGLIAASYAELTVDVIFMLDEEQHQKIASNYRHLLERPWLRQTKLGGRGQRRPAGGQGPGPG